jgi:hypothetical protein
VYSKPMISFWNNNEMMPFVIIVILLVVGSVVGRVREDRAKRKAEQWVASIKAARDWPTAIRGIEEHFRGSRCGDAYYRYWYDASLKSCGRPVPRPLKPSASELWMALSIARGRIAM